MAFLSTLLSVPEPTGMWETIIKAFEGFAGNYVLAIILLTLIIRLIWAPIDTLNKRMSQKMTANQAKMQPELEKINKKYASNPQLLKQKQNEVYKKYNTSSVGSCVFMLVFLGLNLAIFLTLWQGLNSMSAYKNSESYDNLKYEYANCLDLSKNYIDTNGDEIFKDYENLTFEIYEDNGTPMIVLKKNNSAVFPPQKYKYEKDFSVLDGDTVVTTSNDYIINNLIKELITPENEVVLIPEEKDEAGEITTAKLTLSTAIQNVAMRAVEEEYEATKDGFLWIANIWVADTPFQNSVFDYNAFVGSVGKQNVAENEEAIFNSFMTQLRENKGRANGYLILPIICILVTFLTMWLSTYKKKADKVVAPAPAGGKATKIIMPIIFGIFALLYSSIFAIYMVVGQIISALLIPLQNLILNKWKNHDDKKKKEKVEVVEYSRKF